MERFVQMCVAAVAIVIALASVSHAEIVYDNYPGDSFSSSDHYACGDIWFMDSTLYNAMRFDLAAGAYTDISVTLPLAHKTLFPEQFWYQVKIYAADGVPTNPDDFPGEMVAGTCLATIDALASDLGEFGEDEIVPTTFEFDSLVLTGDAQYWLAVETDLDPLGGIAWLLNENDICGWNAWKLWDQESGDPFPETWLLKDDSAYMGPNAAMRIEGTLVPEPSGLLLLLVAAGAVARRRS
ncbi:MAG: PEP-CTERM sorting domain-containing protein [Phycisphaerae bacterium]|jgi:hypothetical protein